MAAIELVNSGIMNDLQEKYGSTVQSCIDNDNKKLAKKLMLEISNFIKIKSVCAESLDTQGVTLKK